MKAFTEEEIHILAQDFFKKGMKVATSVIFEIIFDEHIETQKRFTKMLLTEDSEMMKELTRTVFKDVKNEYLNPISN